MKLVFLSLMFFATISQASEQSIALPPTDYTVQIGIQTNALPANYSGYLIVQCEGQMRVWINWKASDTDAFGSVELPLSCETLNVNAVAFGPSASKSLPVTYEIRQGQKTIFKSTKPAFSSEADRIEVIHNVYR